MPTVPVSCAQAGTLRFVFGQTVVTFDLAADVTLGEIARRLGELPIRRYGDPVAIVLTLNPASHAVIHGNS